MNPRDKLAELLASAEICEAIKKEAVGHANIIEQLHADCMAENKRHEAAIALIQSRCKHRRFDNGICCTCGIKQVVTETVEIDVSH